MDEAESRSRRFVDTTCAEYEAVESMEEFWQIVDRVREQRVWLKNRFPEKDYQIGAAALAAWTRLIGRMAA